MVLVLSALSAFDPQSELHFECCLGGSKPYQVALSMRKYVVLYVVISTCFGVQFVGCSIGLNMAADASSV